MISPDEIEVTPPTAAPKKRLKARKLATAVETEEAEAHAPAPTASKPDDGDKEEGEGEGEEGRGNNLRGKGEGEETEEDEEVVDDESATLTDTDTEAPAAALFVAEDDEPRQKKYPEQQHPEMRQSHDAAVAEHAGRKAPMPAAPSADKALGVEEMEPTMSSARACSRPSPDDGRGCGRGAGPSATPPPSLHPGEHHLAAQQSPVHAVFPRSLLVQVNSLSNPTRCCCQASMFVHAM